MGNSNDSKFRHIGLPLEIKGTAYFSRNNISNIKTKYNGENRSIHGNNLKSELLELSNFWKSDREDNIPCLLQIDENIDIDFLRASFGFEIVSEQDDGYVIVVSPDVDMTKFLSKINSFLETNHGVGSVAQVYKIYQEEERIKRILSPKLYESRTTISDSDLILLDLSIETLGGIKQPSEKPIKGDDEQEIKYRKRLAKRNENVSIYQQKISEIQLDREDKIEEIIRNQNGKILDNTYPDKIFIDSFTIRAEISGECLKDIILNMPYVFEIIEVSDIEIIGSNSDKEGNYMSVSFQQPDKDAPIVGVIDSGIQENHTFLNKAIDGTKSICYIPGKDIDDTADEVEGGGHGTRVAGAVLFGNNIPSEGNYKYHCRIQNIRILNENNTIPRNISPWRLLLKIIENNRNEGDKIKIFNHSINSINPRAFGYMSTWAAIMDEISYSNDILFVQSMGNILESDIKNHITNGQNYPKYFNNFDCRISNPGISLNSLTVGSICENGYNDDDNFSLGEKDMPSAFSRVGPGIWNTIKPELVEYGGTYLCNKGEKVNLTINNNVAPKLIRKGSPSISNDSIGTSFSAPKISYLAAHIQNLFPTNSCLLYKSLIVNSAKWPELNTGEWNDFSIMNKLKTIGYGLPNLENALYGSDYKITLYTPQDMEIYSKNAHIYKINIPDELLSGDYDIRIDVTLSYVGKPRKTRRRHRGYLSTWVDWKSSKFGEDPEDFSGRLLKGEEGNNDGEISWTIGLDRRYGQTREIGRNRSTIQKDWCIIKSDKINKSFCIGVIGHKGWDTSGLYPARYSLTVSFEAINKDIPIYIPIKNEVEIQIEENIPQQIKIEIEQ